jgi:hypothetical protein
MEEEDDFNEQSHTWTAPRKRSNESPGINLKRKNRMAKLTHRFPDIILQDSDEDDQPIRGSQHKRLRGELRSASPSLDSEYAFPVSRWLMERGRN